MRRASLFVALAAVGLLTTPATALMIMIRLSTSQKALQADAVVVGKVTEIEKEDIEVLPFEGAKDKVKMKVAAIKIENGLIGAKTVTHVKVLFPVPVENPNVNQPAPLPGGPVVRPLPIRRPGLPPITLKEGEEGLFFLAKHPTAPSYFVIHPGNDPVLLKADTFKADVALVKAVVATLESPMTALKAEKQEDRFNAAAILIQKYRNGINGPSKQVAIPAEESKAILKVLVDADWNPAPGAGVGPVGPGNPQLTPTNLASQLGLFPGSPGGPAQLQVKPGENYNVKFQEAFTAWYEKNGDKYEIKKFVPTEK